MKTFEFTIIMKKTKQKGHLNINKRNKLMMVLQLKNFQQMKI